MRVRASLEAEDESTPRDAAPELSNVWLPWLVERFASFLHPNEVICTLRCVNRATGEQFRGRPEFAAVRLSQPTPPHAFASRWAGSGAMRDMNLEQRMQLLRQTAASGVVANLELALEAVGFIPNDGHLVTLLEAAAAAGHVDAVRHLVGFGRRLGPRFDRSITFALGAAVKAGHTAVCEALICSIGAHRLLTMWHVGAALRAGRPELADWLLQLRPEGSIGFGSGLAPLVERGCPFLLFIAAESCDLATLMSIRQRCSIFHLPHSDDSNILSSAARSRTADWQAKVEWVESQLPPGFIRYPDTCTAAAARPDAELRLAWLLARGYPADGKAVDAALRAGNMAALELLVARGLRPSPIAAADAAGLGQLEALKKLHERRCPLDAGDVAQAAARSGQLPVLAWAVEELAASLHDTRLHEAVLRRCDLEVLQWLRQRGCPLDAAKVAALATAAAQNGQLPVLAWAVEELGAPVQSAALMDAAAASGRVELMAWLRERGCPWSADTFNITAGMGCELALEWLVERGCPMPDDGGPFMMAAEHNDLATLRCLARLGCPWGPASGAGAVFESCLHPFCMLLPVLRYLVELGCPVTAEDCLRLAPQANEEVREWLMALTEVEVARRQQQQPIPEEQWKRQEVVEFLAIGQQERR
ncbi:hypothetical protein GPECTOR_81g198 [Gonium pectorale]|uniref:Uncharacterized protein n=1 Tax=Gonium pectorale TaxID=33097 RepID=A0A150G1K0_GONPE|nr:hypothetical protein GPECTOR_81g198 [Gonium pectorale]|eukprot:KXZ43749.1 hypothetical protein GPECTOR_81g198 [Gonium pectorale]